MNKSEIMWSGKYIETIKEGQWEYVRRPNNVNAAVIIAIDDGHILLVEQYRVPIGKNCLELPAGLIGDINADEDILVAAARELEEETGYKAQHLENIGEFYPSPGMVSESFNLVKAHHLTKVSEGGGVDDENIIVHRIKLDNIQSFIAQKQSDNIALDGKLFLLLSSQILAE